MFHSEYSLICSRFKADRRGFTLIELLVVISIIALLMAIMMPALQKARKQARNIICRSNLRNLGVAAVIYSEDYNGHLPWQYGYLSTVPYTSMVDVWNNVPNLFPNYAGSDTSVAFCPFLVSHAKYATAPGKGIFPGLEEGYVAPANPKYPDDEKPIGYFYLVTGDVSSGQNNLMQKMEFYSSKTYPIFSDRGFALSDTFVHPYRAATESGHLDKNGECEGENAVYTDGHVSWSSRSELLWFDDLRFNWYVPSALKTHPVYGRFLSNPQ